VLQKISVLRARRAHSKSGTVSLIVDIFTGTILVSLVVYIAVGNYAGRRVKKLDDYYVAGRRAPTVLIAWRMIDKTYR